MRGARLFQILVMAGVAAGCSAKVTIDTGSSGGGGNGTGGASGSAKTVSCDLTAGGAHVCITYDLSADTTGLLASAEATACKSAGGTSPSSCPTTSALGTCTITSAGTTDVETFYSDTSPGLTVAEAQAACTQGGGKFK